MKESAPLPAEFDLTGDADLILARLDEEPKPRHKPTPTEEET